MVCKTHGIERKERDSDTWLNSSVQPRLRDTLRAHELASRHFSTADRDRGKMSCSVPGSLWSSNPSSTAVNKAGAGAGWCAGSPGLNILTSIVSQLSCWLSVEEVAQLGLHGAEGGRTQPAAGCWGKRSCPWSWADGKRWGEVRLGAERDMWCKAWGVTVGSGWEFLRWQGMRTDKKMCPKENSCTTLFCKELGLEESVAFP